MSVRFATAITLNISLYLHADKAKEFQTSLSDTIKREKKKDNYDSRSRVTTARITSVFGEISPQHALACSIRKFVTAMYPNRKQDHNLFPIIEASRRFIRIC